MEKPEEKGADESSSLASKRLIEKLKLNGSKYDNIQESRSILTVFEHQLFVWHNYGSCILTLELGKGDINENTECDVLIPSNPPVFEIESLLFNRMGTLLAMVGRKGVMVMQIPWMSGPQRSQNPVFCRSWHIAERFFICASQVEVLQALWHPGSVSCTHIVVLSSDNYLRLYDASDAQTPLQAVKLGPSNSTLSANYKVSFSACLGENAVSFDFGPPERSTLSLRVSRKNTEDELTYPIYVLYANGDVCIVRMLLRKTNTLCPKVEGPLAMYPPAEDNYGVDACSLICLHSNPPMLAIGMASGIIYHCILLDCASNGTAGEDKLSNPWLLDNTVNESEVSLYVHGSIELPVSPLEDPDTYFQPVRLYKDVTSCYKYHCSLVCGVHTVVVPFIQKIEESAKIGDLDSVSSQSQHNDSIVEHLLCTKPITSVKAVPVIGVASAMVETGAMLVCLLASWEFTCIPMLSHFRSSATPLLSSSQSFGDSKANDSQQENFAQQIQHLLHRSTNTPVLKMHNAGDKDVTNRRQHLELLWNCTNRFREEYIDPLSMAKQLLAHRIKVLVQHKNLQIQELKKHLQERDQLRSKAEQLAEKYEDAHANQQLLLERIEKVLKILQQRYPVLSSAEVEMKHDLMFMENRLKSYQHSLDQLKKKWGQQSQTSKESDSKKDIEVLQGKMEDLNLGEVQLKHIKEIIEQEGSYIAKLVRSVSSLNKNAGL